MRNYGGVLNVRDATNSVRESEPKRCVGGREHSKRGKQRERDSDSIKYTQHSDTLAGMVDVMNQPQIKIILAQKSPLNDFTAWAATKNHGEGRL